MGHWTWAVPVLLVVALLSIQQIDLYPPTRDEFYSMYNSGWVVNSPFTPVDVLESLRHNSSNHTPLYFLLLNLWGNIIQRDIALARVLTIFTALLSMAMTYRLTRDFVAPVAGLLAVIIVASNAFYNYYIPHVRMYPLLALMSILVLWLYLRIIYRQQAAKRSDYLALGIACYLLANTHVLSVTLFLTLGIYHLLLAPKNRRWLIVSLAVILAVLLFSPWLVVVFSQLDRFAGQWEYAYVDGRIAIETWLTLATNNFLPLLLLSAVGFIIGLRKDILKFRPFHFIFVLFLLALGLLSEVTGTVTHNGMRYHLDGYLPFVLFVSAGLYALYRIRKSLALLILLWVLTGVSFQQTADWSHYLAGRMDNVHEPPWQIMSRMAQGSNLNAPIIGYRFNGGRLKWQAHIPYPQSEFYFKEPGIVLEAISDLKTWQDYGPRIAITEPVLWLFYQKSLVSAAEAREVEVTMDLLNYEDCDLSQFGVDTVLIQYFWKPLDCQTPQLLAAYQNALIDYEFYSAEVDVNSNRVLFVDRWNSSDDSASENYSISHQLITDDWEKLASVDVRLVHEGSLRQFSIDITDVPAGNYRLMAILYDNQTGEKVDWIENPGYVPSMLALAEIEIPQR